MEQLGFWGNEHGPGAAPPRPEHLSLAEALGGRIRLGTSSWSFPGWAGLVYARAASREQLARDGLRAYAEHPLLRSIGLDRTYYAPIPVEVYADYAAQVPEAARFVVKAPEILTLARFPRHDRYAERAGQPNPSFLDPELATRALVAPATRGLGVRLGAVVFQFPPQAADPSGRERFEARLSEFLCALPRGPLYAVEIRTRDWLSPRYAAALRAAGACHCLTVHPTMPGLRQQADAVGLESGPALVARWMLGGGRSYEAARVRYAPFNRIVDPDPRTRAALAELCIAFARSDRPALVTVNNKAEGSAPLSVFALARAIVALTRASADRT
jgi:uncharacterized protein YecE (DUF72 family)